MSVIVTLDNPGAGGGMAVTPKPVRLSYWGFFLFFFGGGTKLPSWGPWMVGVPDRGYQFPAGGSFGHPQPGRGVTRGTPGPSRGNIQEYWGNTR